MTGAKGREGAEPPATTGPSASADASGDAGPQDWDSRAYRDTMGQFCTGVVVVAGVAGGELAGFAAQSFVSLSLAPPLIAVCPAKSSSSWPRIRRARRFAVNVLAEEHRALSQAFAKPGEAPPVGWRAGPASGAPVLDEALAYVECALNAEHDAGDHTVVVADVLGFGTLRANARPLLFFRGGYGVGG